MAELTLVQVVDENHLHSRRCYTRCDRQSSAQPFRWDISSRANLEGFKEFTGIISNDCEDQRLLCRSCAAKISNARTGELSHKKVQTRCFKPPPSLLPRLAQAIQLHHHCNPKRLFPGALILKLLHVDRATLLIFQISWDREKEYWFSKK